MPSPPSGACRQLLTRQTLPAARSLRRRAGPPRPPSPARVLGGEGASSRPLTSTTCHLQALGGIHGDSVSRSASRPPTAWLPRLIERCSCLDADARAFQRT